MNGMTNMRYCDHEFHTTGHAEPDKAISLGLPAQTACGTIVCCHCGQVRHLYPSGMVVIAIQEGIIHKNGYPTDNTTS